MPAEVGTVPWRSIILTVIDHIATVTLDNPPLNMLTLALVGDLGAACDELGARDDVRAVVLTGGGERAFSAGSDSLEGHGRRMSLEERGRRLELECRTFDEVAGLPQPTIAAIRGVALGAGLELALACDFRIAGWGAELGFPGMAQGLLPASGGLTRLPLVVGDSGARRLAMLGERVDAREARELGLVDEMVADDAVVERSTELATRLAAQPWAVVRAVKRILGAQRELSHEEALRLTVETALSRSLAPRAAPARRKEGRDAANASARP